MANPKSSFNIDSLLQYLPLLISGVTQAVQFIHNIENDLKQNGEMTTAQEQTLDARIADLKNLPWWQTDPVVPPTTP